METSSNKTVFLRVWEIGDFEKKAFILPKKTDFWNGKKLPKGRKPNGQVQYYFRKLDLKH